MNPPASPYVTTNPYDQPVPEDKATESPLPPAYSPDPPEPPPQPREPQGTACPGCQTQLPSTATFCFRCGTKYGSESAAPLGISRDACRGSSALVKMTNNSFYVLLVVR
jgi:hypothetical protein